MTQLSRALKGEITPEMRQVALSEGVSPELVMEGVAAGTIVIPRNTGRSNIDPVGIGTGLRTKVSASVGLYGSEATIAGELGKIRAAVEAGTDAVMDLSVSGDIDAMRREALASCPKPVGTLPLYQALAEAGEKYGSTAKMKVEELFAVIERQASGGIDFLALHCGTTMDIVERARKTAGSTPW